MSHDDMLKSIVEQSVSQVIRGTPKEKIPMSNCEVKQSPTAKMGPEHGKVE